MGIPSELMKFYRKRAFLPATNYEVEGPDGVVIGVSRDEGEAPDLEGGAIAAPPRKPLVAQSTPATVSGDDNDERGRGILAELSQGIDVDERAALNDPRARAEAQDARNRSDRMSNIMLQSAGLQPLTKQDDPYVSERDKMRDWLMKRAGVAGRNETAGLNAERTKAYLDSIQASRERDLAARALRAEKDGNAAELARLKLELEQEKARTAKEQGDRKLDIEEKRIKNRKTGPAPGVGAGDKKKDLPASMVAEYSSYDVASDALDRLLQSFNAKGMDSAGARVGGIAANVGINNTDAGAYMDEARSAMQGVGLILEGGKLAAGDEVKYARLLPQPGDSKERAREKVASLKKMLADKREKAFRDLDAAGYRTPQAKAPAPAVSTSGRVRVSNGKETREIDAEDLPAAEADGYRRVP